MFGKGGSKKEEETALRELVDALGRIKDPALGRDLGPLGCIRDVSVTPERVKLNLELHLNGHPNRVELERHVRGVVAHHHPGVLVDLTVTANVRAAAGSLKSQGVPGVKNVVLVASGKGGVGKSTVASNLAVALAQDGAQVGLLDADVHGPSMPTMFGLQGGVQFAPTEPPKMVPLTRHGLKLMSIGFLVEPETPMVWRGPMMAQACLQLFSDVAWAPLDYLVVDLPPGTGDIQLTIAQKVAVAGAVLVSTPQDVALSDVVRGKAMFDKVNIATLGLVENMSFFSCDGCGKRHEIFASGGARLAAERLGIPFLGALPLETAVRRAGDEGAPITVSSPLSEASRAFRAVATNLAVRVALLGLDAPRQEPHVARSPMLRVIQ
jgi:ATP-binding protein involved in chromosome partitioning